MIYSSHKTIAIKQNSTAYILLFQFFPKQILTMGFMHFAVRRAAPALTTVGVGVWATITTVNDDWDDYTHRLYEYALSNSKSEQQPVETIVILGSGWAGLNALRKCTGPGKDVVVVSPRPHFLYTPLLAGSAVGTITLRSACEPLRALVDSAAGRAASATFVRADAREVDVINKTVRATTGQGSMELEVSYDKLVIAVGAQPNTFGIPGVKENALFLKEAEDSAKLHAKLLCNLEKAAALMRHGGKGDQYEQEIDRLLKVFVVGGGPTGVELSAELADFAHNDVAMRYGKDVSDRIRIVLVEAMPRILAPFDESLANVAKDHLQSRGVDVRTGVAITSVGDGEATFAPSTPRNATPEEKSKALAQATTEESGVLVWAAGIESRPLVKKLAKALGQTDTRGLKVDSSLRVEGADGVYAIGDAALSGFAPTAQVAAQQGKHIGRSIRDATDSPFAYKHAGSLCCLGQGNGIAQLLVPSESASFNVWEAIGAQAVGPNGDERAITGTPAFILWRSLYWTKLMSTSSRLSLTVDWIKSLLSGRDVVEPVLQSRPTIGSGAMASVETFGSSLQRNSTVKFVEEKAKEVAQKRRFWIL
jgi:NADH:ubiquinone reductase (non-electrogenic)